MPGSGIVYTLTIRDAVQVAEWLRSRGLAVESYTGQTGEGREALEQALLENRVKALVATTALGMGFDKPDLGFVIHYQTPGSVVAYYQQVGRAGRALDRAYGVLLSGEWVTCIPSRRRPDLVPDFAERLATEMGLPFRRALSKVEDRAEQKSMANSVQQARNVDGSLAVSLEPLPGGPVLLVDDMVDSRWTLTVAAWLLRSNGSGEVWPLALALAGHDR